MKSIVSAGVLGAAAAALLLQVTCSNYPSEPPGDYRIKVTWFDRPDSLELNSQYTLWYQMGQDKFERLYAYSVPARFIDTAAVNLSLMSSAVRNFAVTFIDTGSCTLYIKGRAADGRVFGDQCAVRVLHPRPVVAGINKPHDTLFTHLPYVFSVSAHTGPFDTRIESYRWSCPAGSGTTDTTLTDTSISLRFDTPGWKVMSVVAIDTAGDTSARSIDSVNIDQGRPRAYDVETAFAGTGLFVNDGITFMISAADTNGAIDSSRIVLTNTTTSATLAALAGGGSTNVTYTMPSNSAGTWTIDAYVKDNDGLWSDAFRGPATVTVRLGTPRVAALSPDTVYQDTALFTYSILDTNGWLSNVMFAWGDGESNSLTLTGHPQSRTDTIRHYYAADGVYQAIILVADDDGLSSNRTFTLTQKSRTPFVKVKDTQATIEPSGNYYNEAMNFHFEASAASMGGKIVKYVWFLDTPLVMGHNNYDSIPTTEPVLDLTRASPWWSLHYPGSLKFDTAYIGALAVVYSTGAVVYDTFRFWAERANGSGPPQAFTWCKHGVAGDSARFEFENAGGADSILVYVPWVSPYVAITDTTKPQNFMARIQLVADREIELIMLVKHLLYTEKFTIDGARQRIEQYRRTGALKTEARHALERETIENLRAALTSILDILDGKKPIEDPGQ